MNLDEFKNHLKKYLTEQEIDELITSLNNEEEHAALLNTRKMNESNFLSFFPHLKKHPFVSNGYYYNKDKYRLGLNIFHDLGVYYLQEPSAMSVASFLPRMKDNSCILDMCAAPGGKTVQLAINNPTSVIYANDISLSRCNELLSNVERMGLDNVLITNNDFSKIYSNYLEYFSLIVLDAPCSGSGMFRKSSIDMINDWSINKVKKCSLIQKELILIAYKMLKKGGILSYSTCSYSYEENEEVIKYLLENSDATIVPIKKAKGLYSFHHLGYHFFPSQFQGEGQYVVHIYKKGELAQNSIRRKTKDNPLSKLIPNRFNNYAFYKYNSSVFILPFEVKIDKLNIVREGVKVGDFLGDNIFKPHHHLAHTLSKDDYPSIELDKDETNKYMSGNEIIKTNPYKGFVLLTYLGIPISFGKTDGKVIKNHLPKGLRKNFK